MSGICDTCRREPCHMRFDGCKTCDVYEGGESNYTRLFGTPERAARTYLDYFLNGCDGATCGDGCPFFDTSMYMNCALGTDDYDALIEWLKGDAE